MPIQVCFRGPILFVNHPGGMVEAWVPDGLRPIPKGGKPGKHADEHDAKPHHAGILRPKAPTGQDRRIKLLPNKPKVITFRDCDKPDEPACAQRLPAKETAQPREYSRMVPLNKLTNCRSGRDLRLLQKGQPDYWEGVTARVRFIGGTLSAEDDSGLTFRFPKDFCTNVPRAQKIRLFTVWRPSGTSAWMDIADREDAEPDLFPPSRAAVNLTGVKTIQLLSNEIVFAYNHDKPEPEGEHMKETVPCVSEEKEKPLEDEDFKWLYQLVNPPPGESWEQWLDNKPKRLPAPRSTCPSKAQLRGAKSPDVSTCFGGRWGD